MFLNFWALVFKMYIVEVMTYFVVEWLSNHLNFSVVVRIYKIHVFGEAFLLLTIRMLLSTKLFRVREAPTHKYTSHLNQVAPNVTR